MVFRTLGVVPKIRDKVYELGGRLLMGGSIPAREREIVILRTAYLVGSQYEIAQHALLGLDAGMTPTEVDWCVGIEEPDWSADDLDLVTLAEQISRDGAVDEACLDRLSSNWSPAQIVELVFLAGFYRMVGNYLATFDIPLDEGIQPWTTEHDRRNPPR